MGLEVVLFFLSAMILVIQLDAWRRARILKQDLSGSDGGELAAILSFVIGGITIVRLVGLAGSIALGYTKMTIDDAVVLSTITQGLTAIVLLIAVWRVSALSGQAPVDGSGEAVPKGEAETAR